MKRVGVVVVLSCSAASYGQWVGVGKAVTAAVKQRPSQPLEPTGNPGLAPRNAGPLPTPGESDRTFRLIRTGNVTGGGDLMTLTGGLEFLNRGYRVFADNARGNRRTDVWELEGNVRILGRDSVVSGQRIIVDFRNETYRSFGSDAQLSPKFLGAARLQDQLYISGRESYGDRGEILTHDADLTTCTYEHPHFDLEAAESRVVPGKVAILKRVRLRLFGRTALNLPYLVIPLQDRSYRYTPDVGQSPAEGYYIKNRYGVALKNDRILDTRLDYMEKLGTGTGFGYAYDGKSSRGSAKIYQITGKANTLNFSNQHIQDFRWGQLSVENDLQRNNYLTASTSTLLQNRANLAIPWGGGNTRLGLSRSVNDSDSYTTTGQTITLGDNRVWRSGLKTNLSLNHVTNDSKFTSSSTKREQLDVVLQTEKDIRVATATIDYQRSIPIGDTANFYGGADRTPVVTLASDAKRLFGPSVDRALPFKTELSMGEFEDQTGSEHVTRSAFDLNFQKNNRSQDRFKVDYSGRFRQGIYSNDTAQYTLNYGQQMSYRLGRDSSVNLRYNYLRPFGYTPVSIDRTGKTNLVTLDATTRVLPPLLLGVQSGYDMQQIENKAATPWQQVGFRSELSVDKWFLLRGLSTYDTSRQVWSSVRFDLTYRPGATLLSIGSRYDGVQQAWSTVNIFLNNLKVGRTRFSTTLAYNGYTKRFESREYSFIYDLHCAEALLNVQEYETGYQPGRQVQLMIRLKAFPFNIPFGVGRRGQPLGVSGGRDF